MNSSPPMIRLCAYEAIAEGGSAGFELELNAGTLALLVVRRDGRCYAYRNSCPHTGAPLDWLPGRFVDAEGRWIQCATHDALFEFESGRCIHGPCRDQSLQALAIRRIGDGLWLQPPAEDDPG